MSLNEASIKRIVRQAVKDHITEERLLKNKLEKERKELQKLKDQELFQGQIDLIDSLQFKDVIDTQYVSFDYIKFKLDIWKYHQNDARLKSYVKDKFKIQLEQLNTVLKELLKPVVELVEEIEQKKQSS